MIPPFNQLALNQLYQYQLAMAQSGLTQSGQVKGLAELHRAAEAAQRQYLLDMIPPQSSQSQSNQPPPRAHSQNWKT